MAMDVIPHTTSSSPSTLNPNAPMFVPMAYRTVDDFSDQWWALVHSSPWFREYWLQERFQDPQNDPALSFIDDLILPDLDQFFDDYAHQQEEEEKAYCKDLISMGALKWKKDRARAEGTRYVQNAPKIVNVKVCPRTIQQPR